MPAPNNRTIKLTDKEISRYISNSIRLNSKISLSDILNKIIHQDIYKILDLLPEKFVDLLFLDPPYNLKRNFNTIKFNKLSTEAYFEYLESWFVKLKRTLKDDASVYICGDWRSGAAIQLLAEKYLIIQNRITFEREKGRGAKSNWKNCSEDIWFCTVSNKYKFNVDAVKLKKKVIAPYKDDNGNPKDWEKTESGNFRLTYPSNLWTDISIPFWSMPENTPHPTQKPEKLLAKIILASTNDGDVVLDPFAGSGTTCVVAKKLNRNFIGCEIDKQFCAFALKRLEMAENEKTIQGYHDGVFWERNVLNKII